MKYNFVLPILATLASSSCSEKNEWLPTKQMSMEHVRQIASKYGLDSLADGRNSLLLYCSPEEVEQFFQNQKTSADRNRDINLYLQGTANVHSFEDDLKLIESLPAMKADWIKNKGGIEKFNQWVETQRATKWQIYRDKNGGLIYIFANDDGSRYKSPEYQRMDRE